MIKMTKIVIRFVSFFNLKNASKAVFGPGYPLSFPPPSTPSASRTRRLSSQAPSTQIPGYASDTVIRKQGELIKCNIGLSLAERAGE